MMRLNPAFTLPATITARLVSSLLVLFLAFGMSGCSTAISQPSNSPQSSAAVSRSLVNRYTAIINARDASKLVEVYTEDYIQNSGRAPSGLPAQIANWKNQFAAIPDLKMTLHDVITDGDKVAARFTFEGTHTVAFLGIAPTGRKFSFGTIDIWRVKDGKLAEHWDQVDFAGLQRQLAAK